MVDLLFILAGSALIEQIPLAALIGVMFIVVIGTFEWSSFRVIRKVPRSDAMVLVLVSAVTVSHARTGSPLLRSITLTLPRNRSRSFSAS